MKEEILKKLQSGESLDSREALLLEQELESGEGMTISHMVSSLPDAELSLNWRSDLNNQLRAMAPKPKRQLNWWPIGATAAGIACGVMAFVIFSQPPSSIRQNPTHSPIVQETMPNVDDSTFGTALVRAHMTDEAEVSTGIRSPRRTIEQTVDWDSL